MTGYLRTAWDCRYFLLSLVANDLRARYRGSILGLGWSLLNPILMTAVLCFAFSTVFRQNPSEFAPPLFAGLTIWNFIAGAAQLGCSSFLQAECYIRQQPVPMAIYPLRIVLSTAFHLLIGLAPVIALSGWFRGWIGPAALVSLVPSLLLLLILGWAIAVVVGLLNVWFRDTRHLVDVLMQVVFYLTPILYPASLVQGTRFARVLELNPLVPFLELIRETILKNEVPSPAAYGLVSLLALLCTSLAMAALWRKERRLIFYL
jgi:ABC-type polysaccharide/polyol phosphate export permease